MAFCTTYNSCANPWKRLFQTATVSPYEDWVRRDRPPRTTFVNREWMEDVTLTQYIFMPTERLAIMTDYTEFANDLFVVAKLKIDETTRTIDVDGLHCERENYWPNEDGLRPGKIKSGEGRIGFYRKNMTEYTEDGQRALSIDGFASKFFGADWRVLPMPMTRPTLPKALVKCAHDASEASWKWLHGYVQTKTCTIGLFDGIHLVRAATTIQRYYRGWKVRLDTAFNPNTKLGYFYALRDFRELCD